MAERTRRTRSEDPELLRIAEEHRHLMATLKAVERDPATAPTAQLAELCSSLEGHFAREEEPHGLYAAMEARAPHLISRVEALRAEHRELTAVLRELCRRAAAGAPDGPRPAEVREVCQRVRAHEGEESQLLLDVWYTDLGAQD